MPRLERIEVTDRELLEKAAKAAGYSVRWVDGFYGMVYTGFLIDRGRLHSNGLPMWERWNPLDIETGDALRLAVKLRLEVNCTIPDKPTISVYGNSKGKMFSAHESKMPDPEAATCRAIVRAAAAIGEAMNSEAGG
jgi:hypothetical protein